jgi:hypothetical protein
MHAARMTMRESERWIRWEIVGHHHQRLHGGPLRAPTAVWRKHEE